MPVTAASSSQLPMATAEPIIPPDRTGQDRSAPVVCDAHG